LFIQPYVSHTGQAGFDILQVLRQQLRRVVLSVPHFLFMLETLRNSDLVAVLPERLVRGQSGLVVVEPPLAVAGFEMLMLWHERWHRDPAHQWLRQFIVNSLEEQTC
ncbi:HTH-type transcriptional regulator SyrM 1, partial [Klebsiella pneumoniae]